MTRLLKRLTADELKRLTADELLDSAIVPVCLSCIAAVLIARILIARIYSRSRTSAVVYTQKREQRSNIASLDITPSLDEPGPIALLVTAVPCLSACLEPIVVAEKMASASTMEPEQHCDLDADTVIVASTASVKGRLWVEECEHVMVLHWPRATGGELLDDEQLRADYEVARHTLAKRGTPFGLIHDFREATSIATLAPIATKVLPDAIAIASGGLVKRVAVVHSFHSVLVRATLQSLLTLSPVRPCKMFRAADGRGKEWAGAWARDS